jgi:hypothetical protein
MTSQHLYIAGVDRWSDYIRDSLTIDQGLTYEIDTAQFQVRGERPNEGDGVMIEDDTLGRLFAGSIVKVELAFTIPDKKTNVWNVECDDYTEQVDQRLVIETYENMTADAIFKDIVRKYCRSFTTNNVRSGAPTVERIVFDYKRPSECFKELCDYVGWHWYPDYYKDLHFFRPEELAKSAPYKLIPGGRFRNIKHSFDTQGLRNRVYIRGGTTLSNPFVYEIKADGVARAWTLPHKPHDISLTIGGVSKSVGIENVHEEADFDYLMNFEEKYVKASAQTTTVPEGMIIRFTYKYDVDVITMVEDTESQAKLAAIQKANGVPDSDGVYEHVIQDDTLTTIDAAEAAGYADLRENANPKVKGSFETEISGWQPGQIVQIDLSDRGIQGEFLVQKVTITRTGSQYWSYNIQYGGRLFGIADFLKALVSEQQKKQYNETTLLHKFTYGVDKVAVKDEATGILKSPPWAIEPSLELKVVNTDQYVSEWDTAGWTDSSVISVTEFDGHSDYDSVSNIDNLVMLSSTLKATSTNVDPIIEIYNPNLRFSGAKYRYLHARIKVTGAGASNTCQVFWKKEGGATNYNATDTLDNVFTPTGDWQIVTMDMFLAGSKWTNFTITGIRFDPSTASGVAFEIDWIRVSTSADDYGIVETAAFSLDTSVQGIVIPKTPAICLSGTGTQTSGQVAYQYTDIWSGSYIIQPGDFLVYDMYLASDYMVGGLDFHCTDGSNLRDFASPICKDQNGINAHPYNDTRAYSLRKWYRRRIDISAMAGKTIDYIQATIYPSQAVTVRAYYKNIFIVAKSGGKRVRVYDAYSGWPRGGNWGITSGNGGQAYISNPLIEEIMTHNGCASRTSPEYDISKVGRVNFSDVYWEAGEIEGYVFDGRYDFIDLNDTAPLRLTGDMTIEFTVIPFDIGNQRCNIVSKCYGGEFALTAEVDGSLDYYHGNAGQEGVGSDKYYGGLILPAGTFQNGKRVTVAIVRDIRTKTIRGYVNGKKVNELTWSTVDPVASSYPVTFMRGYADASPVAGILTEVRFWNVPRTDQEIADNWDKRNLPQQASLVGYFPLTQADGTADKSQYGTAVKVFGGMPAWARYTFTLETSIDGGKTYQPVISQYGDIVNLNGTSAKTLKFRQTMKVQNTNLYNLRVPWNTAYLNSVTHAEIDAVGRNLSIYERDNRINSTTWFQYSTDGGIVWSNWKEFTPDTHIEEIPYPCKLRIKTSDWIRIRNWKRAFDDTDSVVNFVISG